MDFIDTFELRFPGQSHEEVAARHPSSWRDRTSPSGAVSDEFPVVAFVDGSRWLAKCANPACNGAERVSFRDGLMFCCECRNAHVDNAYVRVQLPDPATRAAIEAALLARPDWQVRGWLPSESVADLLAENAEHGL